ncbi:MAG: PAS domain S-box protein [Geminicoccaceae bacterium]
MAYAGAVIGTGLAVAIDTALSVAGSTPVPHLILGPILLAAALLGGAGPGLAALGLSLIAVALLDPSASPGSPLWPSAGQTLHLGLMAVSGGGLVGLGVWLHGALVRLLASEERFRLAIRSTGLGTWDLDGSTGARHWSSEFRAIIGVDEDTLADTAFFATLIHPDDRDRVTDQYRAAHSPRGDGWYEAEFRIRRADNEEERWVAATGRVYFDGQGKLLRAVGTILDITQRRHVETALRESEERYRTLLETAPDAVHVHRDGVIIFANQQAVTLFGGRVPEDVIGRTAMSLVDPASLALAQARTARLASPGQRNPPIEMILRRLDGNSVPVEAASAVVQLEGRPAILAVLRDTTDRKRSEAALRESETRFRLAAAAIQGIVCDIDIPRGLIWFSDGLERVLGIRPEALPSSTKWWREQIHPEDQSRLADAQTLQDDPELSHLDREYRVRHSDGRWVHVHDRSFVVRDPSCHPLRLIGVLTDVSERKAAEAQQALLMREVDHRARNALTIVQSLVRLTRAPSRRAFIEAVEGRVAALARTHSLLASNRWRCADLQTVIADELSAICGEPRVRIAGPSVSLRPEAVQPVAMLFHELATNAVKHGALSTNGGRLLVSWDRGRDGALHLVWDESDGPPIPAAPQEAGFGSTLMASVVRDQFGGQLECQWRESGLRCEIVIGADRLS